MNQRMKPTELALVTENAAGEVLEAEPTELEALLDNWRKHSYKGSSVLDIEPRRWIVPGWIPADSVIAVYAPPGVGKSFYALSLALAMSNGDPWATIHLEPSPVLYVAAERATELRDRAEAWLTYREQLLPDSFEIMSPARPPQLTNPRDIEALCTYVEESGARLVVLDTYARMTLGIEENSAKETGPILEALDRIRQATKGGTVLVVHHTGKDASRGLRGSTAFLGAVDLTISLEGDGASIRAKVEKSNAGPEPMPEWYRLETVPLPNLAGESRTSAVLISTGAPARNEGLEEAVLSTLRQTSEGSLTMKQLREALEEQGHRVTRPTLDRTALKPLRARGLVDLVGKGPQARWVLTESDRGSESYQLTP